MFPSEQAKTFRDDQELSGKRIDERSQKILKNARQPEVVGLFL